MSVGHTGGKPEPANKRTLSEGKQAFARRHKIFTHWLKMPWGIKIIKLFTTTHSIRRQKTKTTDKPIEYLKARTKKERTQCCYTLSASLLQHRLVFQSWFTARRSKYLPRPCACTPDPERDATWPGGCRATRLRALPHHHCPGQQAWFQPPGG